MEKERASVISNVKSCLVSVKGRLTLKQLERDYKTLLGGRIPYAALGYKTLEDLIRSDPSFSLTRMANGEVQVDAFSEKTSHISDMVNKQKTTTKPRAKGKKVTFGESTKRSVQPVTWRPKYLDTSAKQFQTSQRPAAVKHNQFINYSTPAKPSVPSKVVVPDTSALNTQTRPMAKVKKADISERLAIRQENPIKRERSHGTITSTLTVKSTDADVVPKTTHKCSSLISTKRRITRKMSELSLERDSGNSSPTSELSPVINSRLQANVSEFARTADPIADLRNFVQLHKIGELETSINRVAKQGFFTCNLKVGKHTFYSYPQEFRDQKSAEIYCSEVALRELIPKYTEKKPLLLSSEKDILERIPPMLEKHSNCLWVWQLELDYTDKFQEQLPLDWLKIIDSSPCIQVEKLLDNCVIKHCKPGEALQKGLKWNTRLNITDVSIPSNTVQFGENNRLTAEATFVVSANEIWCRQLDTKERDLFDKMIDVMNSYYDDNYKTLQATTITEGGYYIAYYDSAWYRIRAVSSSETDVHCFFIDFGDETVMKKENVFQLQREFASSQAQAFVCRLIGLEDLYEVSIGSETLQNLVYERALVLEVGHDTNVNTNDDLSIPVYMYDSATGGSINFQLIDLLTIESASPVLPKDSIAEVYISNIEDNGDIYIQIHTHGYHALCKQMASLENEINAKSPTDQFKPITKANSVNKTYLAKYKTDNRWRRATIIDWSPNMDMAQIYFVDYGNTDVIVLNNDVLYPLEKLSDVLNQYPYQAVKVRIDVAHIPKDLKEVCQKEMPLDSSVLLKVTKYDNNQVPWVEFFKRNTEGGLFCINKSIEMTEKMKEDSNNNSIKTNKRKLILAQFDGLNKNVPSGGVLKAPTIPNKNEMLEVHIPFAVNPWNFFIQPLETQRDLHQLMLKLQDTYKDKQYSPLQKDDIVPGKIYASKHEDGNWYRTSVIKVIHAGSISVFYCDFGYYGNLTVQQLIPLEQDFMQLPYQALKAKINGIKPKQLKWTVEDCQKFKELVEGKNFVSVLSEVENDELYEYDIVLKLYLIDTSTEDDVHISNELVKQGIAIQIS